MPNINGSLTEEELRRAQSILSGGQVLINPNTKEPAFTSVSTPTPTPTPAPTVSTTPAPTVSPKPTSTQFTTPSGAVVDSVTGKIIKEAPATVSSSTSVRKDLIERGVTDTDTFNLPTEKSYEEFKATVTPGTTKPEAPNFADVYARMRSEQGLTALEDEDVGLEAEKETALAALRDFKAKESGGISQGFYTGRVSEAERNVNERVDAIERKQRTIQMKLKNKNSFISDYMKFSEKDYETAKEDYEFEFNKNLQIQTAYQNYKTREDAEANRVRDDARAMLATYKTLIGDSGKDLDEYVAANPGFESRINEIELNAGMEPGTFLAFARSKPKANLLATIEGKDASGNKTISFIYDDPEGGPGIVKTIPLPGVKAGTESVGALTGTQIKRLQEFIKPEDIQNPSNTPESIYTTITKLLFAGVELDEIRQNLKESGEDPVLLDKYDRAVGIKTLLYGKLSEEDEDEDVF